jgi:hypothetical protein
MSYTFTVEPSDDVALAALRAWFWRYTVNPTAALILGGTGIVLFLLDSTDGAFELVTLIWLGAIAAYLLLAALAYFYRRRQLIVLLQSRSQEAVTYELTPAGIASLTTDGGGALRWQEINELWLTNEFLLLRHEQGGHTTLPTRQVPDEALQALIAGVKAAGGNIRDRRSGPGEGGESAAGS